ncbi:MAG: hypothetical protein E6G96_09170 [Alphaproteobacteria bacterium]|nr:MAG: hypothetical protein E6G96_09170 [Alphaproteobacteria bacterium]
MNSIPRNTIGSHGLAHRDALMTLRSALVSTVAVAFVVGLASPADAYPRRLRFFSQGGWYGDVSARRFRVVSHSSRRERAEPKKDPGFGDMPKGPLEITVNITTQKVTLYSNGVRVAQGPVSTGVPGHATPRGVFSIIEKDRYHHSNISSGAPTPFMQRITWSGVALHEGVLPGHPASHGCIRTSHDFAQKLWPITKLGVRFIVSRHEVVPVDFEHPKLFVPKQKPAEPGIVLNAPQGPAAPIKLAEGPLRSQTDAGSPASATAQSNDVPLPTGSTETGAAAALPGAPAELRKSVDVPAALPAIAAEGGATQTPSADELPKPAPSMDPAKPAPPSRLKSADQPAKRAGQVAVFVSRKEKKIFVRQGMVPIFDMPIVIEELDRPLGTHVFTALEAIDGGAGMRWNLMTVPTDGSILEHEGLSMGAPACAGI